MHADYHDLFHRLKDAKSVVPVDKIAHFDAIRGEFLEVQTRTKGSSQASDDGYAHIRILSQRLRHMVELDGRRAIHSIQVTLPGEGHPGKLTLFSSRMFSNSSKVSMVHSPFILR